MHPVPGAGKCARTTRDWFFFCSSLAKRVVRGLSEQSKGNQSKRGLHSTLNWKPLYLIHLSSTGFLESAQNDQLPAGVVTELGTSTNRFDSNRELYFRPFHIYPLFSNLLNLRTQLSLSQNAWHWNIVMTYQEISVLRLNKCTAVMVCGMNGLIAKTKRMKQLTYASTYMKSGSWVGCG